MSQGSGDRPIEPPRVPLAPGYEVPRLINGGWQLSRGHRLQALDAQLAIDGMIRLAEAGFTAFDCGDIYVGVEELLGDLLRRFRSHSPGTAIRVHTKFVPDRDALGRLDRRHVEKIVDRSLRRLGVERLDMVQFAWWDYAVPGYVESALWLDELRRAGKIELLGATNFDVPHLREIIDAGVPLVAHQVQFSLLDRRPSRGMQRFCAEQGVALLAYGALAGGFLTSRYLGQPDPAEPLETRSLVKYRLIIDEFGGWPRLQRLIATLDRIARKHAAVPAQVALRWVLDQPGVAVAIVGAVDDRHLEDNLGAFDLALDAADRSLLAEFDGGGPPGDVYGIERDPDGPHAAIMRYDLNRDG